MKKLFYLAALVLVTSCTKNSEQLRQDTQPSVAGQQPTVMSYSFSRVTSGSNESVKFNVALSVPDTSIVKRFVVYRMPTTMVWYVNAPRTQSYAMYDHLGDYPTYSENVWYYFVWEMKSGETIILNKFQVY